jgi:hypothetical protein
LLIDWFGEEGADYNNPDLDIDYVDNEIEYMEKADLVDLLDTSGLNAWNIYMKHKDKMERNKRQLMDMVNTMRDKIKEMEREWESTMGHRYGRTRCNVCKGAVWEGTEGQRRPCWTKETSGTWQGGWARITKAAEDSAGLGKPSRTWGDFKRGKTENENGDIGRDSGTIKEDRSKTRKHKDSGEAQPEAKVERGGKKQRTSGTAQGGWIRLTDSARLGKARGTWGGAQRRKIENTETRERDRYITRKEGKEDEEALKEAKGEMGAKDQEEGKVEAA